MHPDDISRFAATLADGFSQYALFKYICGGKYDCDKMSLFWTLSLALLPDNAICIADSKETNSVLIYVRPQSKEANLFSSLKKGGLKMLLKLGFRSIIRLLRFEAEAQQVAKRHKTSNDGSKQKLLGKGWYLMTNTSTLNKKKDIETISKAYNLGVKVEIVY